MCLILILSSFSTQAQEKFISYTNKHLTYQGRILYTADAAVLTWPGTSVRIHFKGKSISGEFKDSDTTNYYNVIIDNKVMQRIRFDTLRKVKVLVSGLTDEEHTLELFKITEWDKGRTWFYSFELPEGAKLLAAPPLPKRKIEFYGNSITCGYALEDTVHDSPLAIYENNYDAYGAITARHFNAQYQCIAKSGIGIMISWFPLIMPEMYYRLDPNDPNSTWDFSKYRPDVVVINLLQNDSWLINNPKHEQFINRFGSDKPNESVIISAYQDFVKHIRSVYPKAKIICMLGNMNITREGSPWPTYEDKAVNGLNDRNIFTFIVPYKRTPGHPKKEEQRALANELIKFIDEHIQW